MYTEGVAEDARQTKWDEQEKKCVVGVVFDPKVRRTRLSVFKQQWHEMAFATNCCC